MAQKNSMYIVHCTMYIVYCTLYNVHCILYTVLRIEIESEFTLYVYSVPYNTMHYTMHIVMYTVQCTVYITMYYTMYVVIYTVSRCVYLDQKKIHGGVSDLCATLYSRGRQPFMVGGPKNQKYLNLFHCKFF